MDLPARPPVSWFFKRAEIALPLTPFTPARSGNNRVPCRYWAACYRKNPVHLARFLHPDDEEDEEDANVASVGSQKKKEEEKPTEQKQLKRPEEPAAVAVTSAFVDAMDAHAQSLSNFDAGLGTSAFVDEDPEDPFGLGPRSNAAQEGLGSRSNAAQEVDPFGLGPRSNAAQEVDPFGLGSRSNAAQEVAAEVPQLVSGVEEVVEEVVEEAPVPEHEAEASNWVCLTCTYYNSGDAQDCEVCATAKPWVCGVCTYVNVNGAVRRCSVCNNEKPDQQ